MSIAKCLSKYLKALLFFILPIVMITSCEKEDSLTTEDEPLIRKKDTLKDYSPIVHFDIISRLLEEKHIDCIEPNYKGNTWIASGKELYYKNDSVEKTYILDFQILDISIAGDETLWIGTKDGGLGHLMKNGIIWYTKANSDLPRDYVSNVEVGLDGRIWFSSGAFDLGGLLVYNGKKFNLFTPENSILNQHVIDDIGIDHNGSIYVVTSGKVGKTSVYRITDDSWEFLGKFYWVSVFTVGPAGIIYLLVDYSLSSSSLYSNTIYEFKNNTWNKLEADFMSSRITLFTAIKADRRNYCWAASIEENSYVLHVYNGISWEEFPEGLFLGDKITTIETDMDNNVWVGTSQNGIFILKQ